MDPSLLIVVVVIKKLYFDVIVGVYEYYFSQIITLQ